MHGALLRNRELIFIAELCDIQPLTSCLHHSYFICVISMGLGFELEKSVIHALNVQFMLLQERCRSIIYICFRLPYFVAIWICVRHVNMTKSQPIVASIHKSRKLFYSISFICIIHLTQSSLRKSSLRYQVLFNMRARVVGAKKVLSLIF